MEKLAHKLLISYSFNCWASTYLQRTNKKSNCQTNNRNQSNRTYDAKKNQEKRTKKSGF